MKVLFFGSSDFAVRPLRAIREGRHELLAAVTRPDRPKGRSLGMAQTAVKGEAAAMGVPVIQPADVNGDAFLREARELSADIFVVISFGAIFGRGLLGMPEKGCVNLHASLLPKYRGAAPINWAIVNGEAVSGITVMRMNSGLDAGDIIARQECNIGDDETAVSLMDRLSRLGARSIAAALDAIEEGRARYTPQDRNKATYAPMLKKEDGLIDWSMSAGEIYNRVRGLVPWPGTYTHVGGRTLKIIEAQQAEAAADRPARRSAGWAGSPGRVMTADPKSGIVVATGSGPLILRTVQPEGKRAMSSREFVRGRGVKPGDILA